MGEWSAAQERIEAALESETLATEERIFLAESVSIVEALRGDPAAATRLAEVQAQVADRPDVQVRAIVPNMTAFIALGEGRDRDAADAWLETTRFGLGIVSSVFLDTPRGRCCGRAMPLGARERSPALPLSTGPPSWPTARRSKLASPRWRATARRSPGIAPRSA